MSSQSHPGPTPTSTSTPTPSQLQSAFDHGIWYLLSLWPALHVACSNNWGGPDSSDKRDWFAGAVSDLLTSQPATDAEDLECFLLQIMQDEFDCNVEDESEVEVARNILRLKKSLVEDGALEVFREVEGRWRMRGSKKIEVQVIDNGPAEEVGDDEEWEGFGEDEEMEDAEAPPSLVPVMAPKEKPLPEVDEDGFTKVVGKKKR